MKKTMLTTMLLLLTFLAFSQESNKSQYIWPEEADVRENIAQWQDLKFGLFIHWGIYSQIGVIESWSLAPDDISWQYRSRNERKMSYAEYTEYYNNLYKGFNPLDFDPSKWATAAKYAGMKYVVFTTKHHDGFNMFDTKQTDYKITADECPFHTDPRANISQEVFNAFRNQGFMTGAYFSIADWHHDDYWWRVLPPKSVNINYNVANHPEKWQRFNDFVASQLEELTCGTYGKLPLMWFDLCSCTADGSASIDWPRMANIVRNNQPGTILVARGQNNIYENYRTPEQKIPEQALDYPWESCITMTFSWSWRPGLTYKPTSEILSMLVKVVSRGGNLLLNVGPKPDGTLEDIAYERLHEIGDWMQVNSEGIYGSKAYAPYQDGNVFYTTKDGYVYAFYIPSEDGAGLPKEISFKGVTPVKGSSINMLGSSLKLKYTVDNDTLTVRIPDALRSKLPCDHIWCLKIKI